MMMCVLCVLASRTLSWIPSRVRNVQGGGWGRDCLCARGLQRTRAARLHLAGSEFIFPHSRLARRTVEAPQRALRQVDEQLSIPRCYRTRLMRWDARCAVCSNGGESCSFSEVAVHSLLLSCCIERGKEREESLVRCLKLAANVGSGFLFPCACCCDLSDFLPCFPSNPHSAVTGPLPRFSASLGVLGMLSVAECIAGELLSPSEHAPGVVQ